MNYRLFITKLVASAVYLALCYASYDVFVTSPTTGWTRYNHYMMILTFPFGTVAMFMAVLRHIVWSVRTTPDIIFKEWALATALGYVTWFWLVPRLFRRMSRTRTPAASLNISRIDLDSHIVFVAPSTDIVTSAKTTQEYLDRLSVDIERRFPQWGKQWLASFFLEPRYATYKEDPQIQLSVQDGTWAEAYLAEYDNRTRTIVTFPAIPFKAKTIKLE